MNKNVCQFFLVGSVVATAWPIYARDTQYLLPIATALESKEAVGKLDGSVTFRFGRESSPQVIEILRSETVRGKAHTSRGTMEKLCNESFLSAMVQLQKSAKRRGVNAVVNIVSAFQGYPEMSSATQYECYQGTLTTSAMLRGDIVKIADK